MENEERRADGMAKQNIAESVGLQKVGFVRNVRSASGWETLRVNSHEMAAMDGYLRNRHWVVASQVCLDVKKLGSLHGLGAMERSVLLGKMFEKRTEHLHIVLEHFLSMKAAMFHEMAEGGVNTPSPTARR